MKSIKLRQLLFTFIFFFSGFSALIYQISWQRLLSVYYGVGSVSIAIIVTIFMLGLGIGGLAGGKWAERSKDAGVSYLAIELGIGLFGYVSMSLLGVVGRLTAGSNYALTLFYVTLFLLIPTVLMGMTLPIVTRILFDINRDNLKNVSKFYFANTLGAAFGAIAASYYLISFYGIEVAVQTAVAINVLLAAAIFFVTRNTQRAVAFEDDEPTVFIPEKSFWFSIYGILFINGLFAIGYQIIWFRVIAVILRDSTYSFSTTLGIYLFGIGLGGYWISKRGPRAWSKNLLGYYFLLNGLVAITSGAIFLLVNQFAQSWPLNNLVDLGQTFTLLPYLDKDEALAPLLQSAALVIFWPTLFLLIPTFLMGASFPIGISLIGSTNRKPGFSLGLAYACTIAGNALGSLLTLFVFLPLLGTTNVFFLFVIIQTIFLFFVNPPEGSWLNGKVLRVFAVLAMTFVVVFKPASVDFYKKFHLDVYADQKTFFEEGVAGISMLFLSDIGNYQNYINGNPHGARPGPLYVNETFVALGHSTSPKNVLIIGFGLGTHLNSVLLDERVEHVTVVELNGTSLRNLRKIPEIKADLDNPKVTVINDDGRRFLEQTKLSFDLITMDPMRSRGGFSNNIYSKEFFELVKEHLMDTGIFLVWTDDYTFRIGKGIAKTFDYVDRYEYFYIAGKKDSVLVDQWYGHLNGKVPLSVRQITQKIFTYRHQTRQQLLDETELKSYPTDLKPILEYYLGELEPRCYLSKKIAEGCVNKASN